MTDVKARRRLVIEYQHEATGKLLVSLAVAVQHNYPLEDLSYTFEEPKPVKETPIDRTKKYYVAINTAPKAVAAVLDELGEGNLMGAMFKKIVESTVADTHITAKALKAMGYKAKTVESNIQRLKDMGFIESKDLPSAPPAPTVN